MATRHPATTFKFRSTPPRGGRPRAGFYPLCGNGFRSTPPRGGRLHRIGKARCIDGCFDPRPREGGDCWLHLRRAVIGCFDPRPREGGDELFGGLPQGLWVSIHAPARGATADNTVGPWAKEFRSTPPRGGRPDHVSHRDRLVVFRSTPPRGGRPSDSLASSHSFGVSIHAPARGATTSGPQSIML